MLRAFEEHHIPISCISGSSIGSIIGAAYASGPRLQQIIEKCREIRFRDFARWRVSRFGLASNERLGALVQRFFDSRQFEDLAIPTAIVATDLGMDLKPVYAHPNGTTPTTHGQTQFDWWYRDTAGKNMPYDFTVPLTAGADGVFS